jgi:hypothetical protein
MWMISDLDCRVKYNIPIAAIAIGANILNRFVSPLMTRGIDDPGSCPWFSTVLNVPLNPRSALSASSINRHGLSLSISRNAAGAVMPTSRLPLATSCSRTFNNVDFPHSITGETASNLGECVNFRKTCVCKIHSVVATNS